MSHIPYRTGLTTILAVMKTVCRLAAKYRTLWGTFMTSEQLTKFDQLVGLCEDIIEIINLLRSGES